MKGSNMSKVVVLAELYWIGHFETQMKLLVEIILKWGWKVIVLCPGPLVMDSWVKECLPEYKEQFYASYFAASEKDQILKQIRNWNQLQNCVQSAERKTTWKVDVVFLTGIDGFLPSKIWQSRIIRKYFMTYPWVGIYFQPKPYRSDVDIYWKKRIRQIERTQIMFTSPYCYGIGVLDEDAYNGLVEKIGNSKVFLLPDVTDERLPDDTSTKIAEIRTKAGDRPIVGLIGVLSPRKGVLNLLRSINIIDSSKCFFLMIGKLLEEEFGTEERRELKKLLSLRNTENCYFDLEYISDAEAVNSLVNVCDVLYLAYEDFYYSSGFLTKAAVFKKLVIVSKGYTMGKRVEAYKLGVTVREGNISDTVELINYLVNEDNRNMLLAQAEFDQYHSLHRLSVLEQTLRQMFGILSK